MLNVMLFTAAAVSSGQLATDHAKPICQNIAPQLTIAADGRGAQRLDQLPNANLILGVLRTENGCSRPAIVREEIGSSRKRR